MSSTKLAPPFRDVLELAARIVAGAIGGQAVDHALTAVDTGVRPAVMDLVFTSLRSYGRGDFFLAQLIERPVKDTLIRGLLLVALARLELRPEEAHTIVDEAVKAAAKLSAARNSRLKGLVNGVLRSYVRLQTELIKRANEDPVARDQHPGWWIARLQADHPHAWREIVAAGNSHPPMSLRANRRRVLIKRPTILPSQSLLEQLLTAGIGGRIIGDEAVLLDKPLPVDQIPGFRQGDCSVQDAGAQRAAHLLDVKDGQRVLDACAAPGGKTAHLLELATLDLTALDADPLRATRVTENLKRLGLRAELRVTDTRNVKDWWDGRPFDRILADVPCSASGVVRRHPDAKWLRREADLTKFAVTQRAIIDALWHTLACGGKMLYATCSLFAQENQQQISAFLARHGDATLEHQFDLLPTCEHDGFYYALLQKH